jgi:hypothetical protein
MATTGTTPPAKMRALQYDTCGEGAAGLKVKNTSRSQQLCTVEWGADQFAWYTLTGDIRMFRAVDGMVG